MALPDPFNSVAQLLAFTSFEQGASNGQDSVLEGTFAFSQFETALRQSRYEIFRKTGKRQNDEFDEDRLEELREAELWLSTARLYRNYGERIALKFPESNLSGINSVQIGADTPPPTDKGVHWVEFMQSRIRAYGLMLLESPSNRYSVAVSSVSSADSQDTPYSCLSPNCCGGCYDTTNYLGRC